MAVSPSLAPAAPHSPPALTPGRERGEGRAASPSVSRVCACADGSAHPTDTGGSLEKTLPPFSPALLCSRRPGPRFCVMGRTFVFGTGRISGTEPRSRPWCDEIRSNGLSLLRFVLEVFLENIFLSPAPLSLINLGWWKGTWAIPGHLGSCASCSLCTQHHAAVMFGDPSPTLCPLAHRVGGKSSPAGGCSPSLFSFSSSLHTECAIPGE